jgi:hypothetical protein
MKVRFLVLSLITPLFFLISEAQIRIGILTGLNLGSITTPDEFLSLPNIKLYNLNGFTIGFIGEFTLTNTIRLQIEPRYIQKGQKSELIDPKFTSKIISTFDYLELPILVKAEFGESDFRPFVLAGPNIGFLLSISSEAFYDGQSVLVNTSKKGYKANDFALDFGAGVEYKITSILSLSSSIRYSLGLLNIHIGPVPVKTRGTQIFIGCLFSL